jgi:hypothetical protein
MASCPRSATNRKLDGGSWQCGYSRLEALMVQPSTDDLQEASAIISKMFETIAALKADKTGRKNHV